MHDTEFPPMMAETMPAVVPPDRPSRLETQQSAVTRTATGTAAERALALEMCAHAATLPPAEAVAALDHPNCQRCEVLPPSLTGDGTLHLNLPHTHTLGKILSHLVRTRQSHTRQGWAVSVDVEPNRLGGVVGALADLMTYTERRDARAFFQPRGTPADLTACFQIERLDTFSARAGSEWLLDLLRRDQLTSHFQPILTADGRTVYGYECLLRADLNGKTVAAGVMFDAARRADLIFQVDLAARRAALRGAARHGIRDKVFVNFTPNSIYDPKHCLDSTARLCGELGLSPEQMVFEMVESEKLPDLDYLKSIVDYYRGHGYEVALDDLGAGYASLQLLISLRPEYVKLDMSLTRGVDADPHKAVLAAKLLEAARDMGLRTVAEGIETAGEWDWVRDHGADFVQGYLFARPASPPPMPATAGAPSGPQQQMGFSPDRYRR